MGTFTDFLRQLVGLSAVTLNENEASDFLTNVDKILDQYKLILNDDITKTPTQEEVSRYYIYYAAFTKFNAIKGNVEWDTADTYPMSFDEFNGKVQTGGWSFMRNSIGIPIREWNIILPEEDTTDNDWGYDTEPDYNGDDESEGDTY